MLNDQVLQVSFFCAIVDRVKTNECAALLSPFPADITKLLPSMLQSPNASMSVLNWNR